MNSILAAIKMVIFFVLVLLYFITASPLFLFIKAFPYKTRKAIMFLVKIYCEVILIIMRAKVSLKGHKELLTNNQNYYIVSNHMSYMDILFINRYQPCSFVTSMEVKEAPFLGQLTTLAGCVFVERRNKENISQEIMQITDALKGGLNVCIFPEATSTNGEELLRFRKPLYQAGLDAKIQILPICLHYKKINKEPITKKNRDFICWYGDMEFFPHLWGLMKQQSIEIEIEVLPPITPREEDTPLDLATRSHDIIEQVHQALV